MVMGERGRGVMACGVAVAALVMAACTPEAKEPAREVGAAPATATASASATATATATAPATATATATAPATATATATATAPATATATVSIPPDSGDYRQALADATAYKKGTIPWAELEKRVLARKLPPHRLGCAYLMTPVPMPPPGVSFDPKRMPKDWEGTWGEVAMTYFAGVLTQEELDKLHAVAHRGLPPKH